MNPIIVGCATGVITVVVIFIIHQFSVADAKITTIRKKWVGKYVMWKGNKALVMGALHGDYVEISIVGHSKTKVPITEIQHLPEEAK